MARKKLEGIIWPNLPDDEYYLDAEKVEYNEEETYPDGSAGKAIQTKANTNGTYDSMTVGNAEQLVSNVRVNDKTPYLFRTSGGSVDIGDREYVNGIVGGTVAWNQLVRNYTSSKTENGITFTNNNTSIDLVGTVTTAFNYNQLQFATGGYDVLRRDESPYIITINKPVPYGVGLAGYDVKIPAGETTGMWYASGPSNWSCIPFIKVEVGDEVNIHGLSANVFDIKQMFGASVANYVKALELSNAGAGVAWFKKLFPKPYYAYNAGTLKHVEGLVSHDMNGFNQWDEEWERGSFNINTGEKTSSNDYVRTKNPIHVIPNTAYCVTAVSAGRLYYYDADMGFISASDSFNATVPHTFVTPSNCNYINYRWEGTSYSGNICINLHWDGSRDGEYEPYVKNSYPLDSDLTLRGIPKLDANNELYYDGDTYEADGTVTRKYGIVDLGTLNWVKLTDADWNCFYTQSLGSSKVKGITNLLCKYPFGVMWGTSTDKIVCGNDNNGYIYIRDSQYAESDAAAFKTAMSGVYLVYELKTPTTETADPYQQVQICNDFGTEEYVLDDSAFPVPVGHDTDYPVNLVAKLEMAPNSPSGDGMYVVKQTNGTNEYVPLIIPSGIPSVPTTDGSYTLTATVSGGTTTLSWS